MNRIPPFPLERFAAVAIGSSTGGPGLVERIISGLPADMPVPIFIAQHLPPQFTLSFAKQIDRISPLTVMHAENGMPVLAGTVYVAPGRQHMRVQRGPDQRVTIEVSTYPDYLIYKPSVDELLRSCVQVYQKQILAVVLSGIGRDGTEGARQIHESGGMVLTQSAATCAVYGMPRSILEAGFSDAELDPENIRKTIVQLSPQHRSLAIL